MKRRKWQDLGDQGFDEAEFLDEDLALNLPSLRQKLKPETKHFARRALRGAADPDQRERGRSRHKRWDAPL